MGNKLVCPRCGTKVTRRFVMKDFEHKILGGATHLARYTCKEHGEIGRYNFDYIAGHEDEWAGRIISKIRRYGLLGKILILLVILSPLIVIGIISQSVVVPLVIFAMTFLCGYGYPISFIVCAFMNHSEDMRKLKDFEMQFRAPYLEIERF